MKNFIFSIILIFSFTLLFFYNYTKFIKNVSSPAYDFTIVIDAGHGGFDPGCVSSIGTKESMLNLSISKKLNSLLLKNGYNTVITRADDKALSSSKSLDMQARKKIISSSNADLVISIHMNKFKDTSRRGIQVFYDDTLNGKAVGILLQNIFNNKLNIKYAKRDNLTAIAGDLFITKCSIAPSVIIECGFLSNIEEEKLLLTNSYQNEIVNTIFFAIESYNNEKLN